ncbi:MAG: HEAT repeat domain-containing protein, partial [Spirochaetia bacterium]|nr:HEAT repeat domain-containing protein [Spirochaetia bacterium]
RHPFPASPDVFWSEADEFKSVVAVNGEDEAVALRLKGYNYLNLAEMVLFALGEIGGDKAEERVIPYLDNRFSYLRGAAAIALGRMGSAKGLSALEQRMGKEQDKSVRARMCLGLLMRDKTRTKVYLELLDLLKDRDDRVRLESALALRELGMGESSGALKEALAAEESSLVRGILEQAVWNAEVNNILPADY